MTTSHTTTIAAVAEQLRQGSLTIPDLLWRCRRRIAVSVNFLFSIGRLLCHSPQLSDARYGSARIPRNLRDDLPAKPRRQAASLPVCEYCHL